MSLIENWNTVPFDLELIVDFDSHGPLSHEDVRFTCSRYFERCCSRSIS